MNIKDLILQLPLMRNPQSRAKILAVPKSTHWGIKKALRQIKGRAPKRPQGTQVFSVRGSSTFFGYYDIHPANRDESKVLAHVVRGPVQPLKKTRPASVGYFSPAGEYTELGTTTAWCWQMGARLRWLPGSEENLVIFSDARSGSHGASVVDISTGVKARHIGSAPYDIDPDGSFGLTLDFSRLARLRPGYGYVDVPEQGASDAAPDDNGIWRVDMQTSERELLFDLATLSAYEAENIARSATHYLNHISIAPNGKDFIFFHITVENTGPVERWKARLFKARTDGSQLQLLADDANPSHYAWTEDGDLLVTMVRRDGSGSEYRLFTNDTILSPFKDWLPQKDGHPSYSPDQRYLLNDTYPDAFGEQTLEVYQMDNGQRIDLGHYGINPFLRGEVRCDLHPRWSADGNAVYFDSTHQGKRRLYRVPFSAL